MDSETSNKTYPFFCHWDVDKYQSKYPSEHWNLCKRFMMAHKTKYPEARLAQLTEAFFNMGVHGRCSDPKTDRIVAALSLPVVTDLFLYAHAGAENQPFRRQLLENAIDSGRGIKPGSETEDIKPLTAEEGNSRRDNNSQGDEPVQCKKESGDVSSVKSLNTLESKQNSREGSAGSSESRQASTKSSVGKQHSTKGKEETSAHKRVSAERGGISDKKQNGKKSEFRESKRRRVSKSPDVDTTTKKYTLKKVIDVDSLKEKLKDFVVFRGVTKESTIKDDLSTLEDSFRYSKVDYTWQISENDKTPNVIRVSLLFKEEVLVEAEGQNKKFLQDKIAEVLLRRLQVFPTIKASFSYYNNGSRKNLPVETRYGPCRCYVDTYTTDVIKDKINKYAMEKDFKEMILLQNQTPGEFSMEDIIEFIEKEKADKLWYRLAEYCYEKKTCPAICVSQIHDIHELLENIKRQDDKRYCVIPFSKNKTRDSKNGVQKSDQDKIKSNKADSTRSPSPRKKRERSSSKTSAEREDRRSRKDKSAVKEEVSSTSRNGSTAESPTSKQPPAEQLLNLPIVGKKDKNEKLSWVGKEHLSAIAKSIYLVKFVKDDSTTENSPFNLLNTTCSLEFNISFKYVMKPCENKMWRVSVILMYENGNILVSEATANTCAEARLVAAQTAVNTIQSRCKVVEPNFKYFAEGGVPTFISLKNPTKTATYEIFTMDTIKTPFSQLVVNLVLEMFKDDNTTEDLFFLASDYTSEERERVCKTSQQYGLGCRMFGQRSNAAAPEDLVSTKHVCVYHIKSALQLVQQLIICGGSTDKYSIVAKSNATLVMDVVPEAPAPSEEIRMCHSELLPGGCCDVQCSLTHLNMLDIIVNKLLAVR